MNPVRPSKEALNSLRIIPLFAGVGDDDLESIAALLIERRIAKGHTIVEEGLSGDYMYILAEGQVKVTKLSGDGREKILELLGPGENTDLYREKIPADGGFALHHVGITQLGMHRVKPALAEAGFAAVVELGMRIGPIYSVDVAYFDTRDELGFYLEILEFKTFGRHSPLTEKLVSRIGRLQRPFRRKGSREEER